MTWPIVIAGAALLLYALLIAGLVLAGRRWDARALAGFIPDCVILLRRLLADERVPRSRKLLLVALIGYLAMPIDLVPDFIPVAGQLDDAILVALVLRSLLRATGPDLAREHWPGPQASLEALLRLT
jgi:uncharacterized membrane protein YkvA (DUF1232 family)